MSENDLTRIITLTSGKGGVGKTNISVNLALQLATSGYRTCLFDADLGLANINILLGLSPEYSLEDVIFDHRSIQDILIRDFNGIDIIPGSSGVEKMANLKDEQVDCLTHSFSDLEDYDFFLFDTSAGVSRNIIAFCMTSPEVILILTPEPTSMTDAYALLKILTLNRFEGSVRIIVNQCKNTMNATAIYTKFKTVVKHYLNVDVTLLGIVVKDQKVVEAVKNQRAFMLLYPDSNASKCIKHIAKSLLKNHPENFETPGMVPFWTKCLQIMKRPLQLTSSNKETQNNTYKPSGMPLKNDQPNDKKQEEGKSSPEKSRSAYGAITSSGEKKEKSPQNRTLKKENISSKTGKPLESDFHAHPEEFSSQTMNKLIESVSSVSQELQLIREALRECVHNGFNPGQSAAKYDEKFGEQSIILDFETFLKRRGVLFEK